MTFEFDFTDEEIAENYMSWLKGLATRLTSEVLPYYFPKGTCPLLLQAQRFFTYPEAMTRTAARTVALCLFKTKHPEIVRIACETGFFTYLTCHIRRQWLDIDALISSATRENCTKLQVAIDEQTDQFYYLNDLCDIGDAGLMSVLAEELLRQLIFPLIGGSLVVSGTQRGAIAIQLAEFMFIQLVSILRHKVVVNAVIAAVFGREISPEVLQICTGSLPPVPAELSYSIPVPLPVLLKPDTREVNNPKYALKAAIAVLDAIQGITPIAMSVANPIRLEILSFLRSKDDNLIVLTCLTVLSTLNSQEIQRSVLVTAGLLPSSQVQVQRLYEGIVREMQGGREEWRGESDGEVAELLLDVLTSESPFHLTTLHLTSHLLSLLRNHLSPSHLPQIRQFLLSSLHQVTLLSSKTFYIDLFVDLFETEKHAILTFTPKITNIVSYLLPVSIENDTKLPLIDRYPNGEIEIARRNIHFFLLLLQLWSQIVEKSIDFASFSINCNYVKGQMYDFPHQNITKCVHNAGKTNQNRYLVLDDPNYLVLAVPEEGSDSRAVVEMVILLRKVEAMVDRTDPRDLVLAVQKDAESVLLSLSFASAQLCLSTKKVIDSQRKSSKSSQLSSLEAFLSQVELHVSS